MARADVPSILWEASFANTLEFGYPLDMAVSWSDPRAGFEYAMTSGGEVDAWDNGVDYFLRGTVRWVPVSSGTVATGLPISGWDGSSGFRAFLDWARKGNLFRFCPNRGTPGTYIESYLVEPLSGYPALEIADTTKRFDLIIRNTSTEYTGY